VDSTFSVRQIQAGANVGLARMANLSWARANGTHRAMIVRSAIQANFWNSVEVLVVDIAWAVHLVSTNRLLGTLPA
jgi:hypothetical protein